MSSSYGLETAQQANFIVSLIAASRSVIEARENNFEFDGQCPILTKYEIRLDEIRCGKRLFRLNSYISVVLSESEDGQGWEAENKDLGSLTFGADRVEAVRSFCEDFASLWDQIANAPTEELAPDAQRVKDLLLSLVKTVQKD